MNRRKFIQLAWFTTACAAVYLTGTLSPAAESTAKSSSQVTGQSFVEKDGWIIGSNDKCHLLEQQVLELRTEIEGIKNSKSWRITQPIRQLKEIIERVLSKK